MTDDLTTLLDSISALLEAPIAGTEAPELARIERTLTDGYARALAIEAERWRLERRIGEVAGQLGGAGDESRTTELAQLARRLSSADGDLVHLRGKLSALLARARVVRVQEVA